VIVVCSYCRKTIREDRTVEPGLVSHGMCPPCSEHFGRLWSGMSLADYLDLLPHPVMLVDGEGRVVAVNSRIAAMLGGDRDRFTGLLGGEAMECVHSRLPEGCGKTIHCRECTVRRSVDRVNETGKAVNRVPAYLQTAKGRIELRVSVRKVNALMEVTVEELRPAPQRPGQA
jgi:PAS domain-containing protein